jgi:hypothetical protein
LLRCCHQSSLEDDALDTFFTSYEPFAKTKREERKSTRSRYHSKPAIACVSGTCDVVATCFAVARSSTANENMSSLRSTTGNVSFYFVTHFIRNVLGFKQRKAQTEIVDAKNESPSICTSIRSNTTLSDVEIDLPALLLLLLPLLSTTAVDVGVISLLDVSSDFLSSVAARFSIKCQNIPNEQQKKQQTTAWGATVERLRTCVVSRAIVAVGVARWRRLFGCCVMKAAKRRELDQPKTFSIHKKSITHQL